MSDIISSGGDYSNSSQVRLSSGTHINHRAKFDAASFILGGEIRNRTNKHTQTNSKRYIHTLPIGMCG